MIAQQFYKLSNKANELVMRAQKLMSFHISRYKHFVDSSPRGTECTYAKLTHRYYEQESESQKLVLELHAIAKQCIELAAEIEKNG